MSVTIRLSIMMFLQFFIWGAWYVTVGNYMGSHDLASEIGNAYSVGPIAAMISPFFLGFVADRFFNSEKVLGLLHILGGIAMFAVPNVENNLFIYVLMFYMLCYMPTLSLTNTIAFHSITNSEKQFPLIRVFGTIGWIAAGILVSKILAADTEALQFQITGAASILLGVFSFFLMKTPPPLKGKQVTVSDVLGLKTLSLLKQPSFLIFILCSMLICVPLSAYYAFAPVYVTQSGAFIDPATNESATGFYMSFGQMSEILFMLVMPFFFRKLGVKWMLLVGMAAWVVRYGLFSYAAITPDYAYYMILGGILLHGICYDFFFVTGQIYTDQKAGPELRGQAQGFLVFTTLGIGMFFGAQIAGKLHTHYVGTKTGEELLPAFKDFWLAPTIMAAVIMVIFFLTFWDKTKKEVSAH